MGNSYGAIQERVVVVAAPNGLLEVTVPNQPELVAKIRTMPGRWWHWDRLIWTVPDSQASRDKLRDMFAGVLAEGSFAESPIGPRKTPASPSGCPGAPPGEPSGEPPGTEDLSGPADRKITAPALRVAKPTAHDGTGGWDVQEQEGWEVLSPAPSGTASRSRRVEEPPAGARIRVTFAMGFMWLVSLPYVQAWVDWMRSLEGSRWDPGRRAWRVPDTPGVRRQIQLAPADLKIAFSETPASSAMPGEAVPSLPRPEPAPEPRSLAAVVAPRAEPGLESPDLRQPASASTVADRNSDAPRPRRLDDPEPLPRADATLPPAEPEYNAEVFRLCDETLRLRVYAPSTQKAYLFHLRSLARFARKDLRDVDEAGIKAYILHMLEDRGLTRQHVNQSISAMKFLYDKVLRSPRVISLIPRPRRVQTMPTVLGRDEVLNLLRAVPNIKHRTILILAYSAGLRVSEVVKLRPRDIDVARGLINVRQGKGSKCRCHTLTIRERPVRSGHPGPGARPPQEVASWSATILQA